MASSKRSQWKAGKRVLRYVLGTIDHGIHYKKNMDNVLVGYSDWGENIDDYKSTFGMYLTLVLEQFHRHKEAGCCRIINS